MSKSDDKKLNQLTAADLYEAIGGVDEELLARAEMDDAMAGESAGTGTMAARRKLRRYLPLVAAAVVMIGLTGLWMTMRRTGMGSTAPVMQEAATEAPEAAMEEAAMEEAVEEAAMEEAPMEEAAAEVPAESVETAAATAEQDSVQADAAAPAGGLLGDTLESSTEAARSESSKEPDTKQDTGPKGSDEVGNMRMQASDGTHTVVFQLNDSPSAVSLYNQLPFDATVENYGSNEKIFTPPAALDKTDGIEGGGKAGGIAYFSPWGNIAMYYGNFSSYPGLYLLGEATSGAEQISALSGTVHFTAAE